MTDETGIRALVAAINGLQVNICCVDQVGADRALRQLRKLFRLTGRTDETDVPDRIHLVLMTPGCIAVQLPQSYTMTGGSHIVPAL